MGPSGAGKSTILDILSKRTPTSEGSVSIFSIDVCLLCSRRELMNHDVAQVSVNGDDRVNMTSLASYVEQSDALLGVLTVQETIGFAARLR